MKSDSLIRYSIKPGAFAPVVQLRLLDPANWEKFVEKCCQIEMQLNAKYVMVKRLGGAGDKGRDVQALMVKPVTKHQWDLYQCKHYKEGLTRSNVYPEFAKFFGHLLLGSYPEPANYFLCAPMGCGADLHDLLTGDPAKFRDNFIKAWKSGDLGLKSADITPKMEALLKAFDFARIREYQARDLVMVHAKDPVEHFKLFGITPQRPIDPVAPQTPSAEEEKYIRALLEAYSEDAASQIDLDTLAPTYDDHFAGCRGEFYSAEGLKRFSRDIFPGEFGNLLDDVHIAIKSVHANPMHKKGIERLTATTAAARSLQVNASPLSASLRGPDLAGSCHHLVNEGRIKWVK